MSTQHNGVHKLICHCASGFKLLELCHEPILVFNCIQVFIAAHWLGTIFSGWSMQAMNAVIALTIVAGSVVDIGPTTASYTSSLRDVRPNVPMRLLINCWLTIH